MKEQIRTYLQQTYGHPKMEPIKDDTPLLSSGLVDSISALELVEFLEKSFGFEFEAHEVDRDNLDNLSRIVAFVNSKKQ